MRKYGWLAAGTAGAALFYVLFAHHTLARVWVDEPNYTQSGLNYLHGDLAMNPEHPPLAKYLLGLWQLVAGEGPLPSRLMIGALVACTCMAMWWLLKPTTGPTAAMATAFAWGLMPRMFQGEDRVDRFVSLDVFMVMFLIAGIAFTWHWYLRGGLWRIAVAGGLIGAAAMCKLTALLAVPALFVLVPPPRRYSSPGAQRTWGSTLVGMAVFTLGAAVVCVAILWPFGVVDGVRRMVELQSSHNALGQTITLHGSVYGSAPWWATFDYAWESLGLLPLVALVGGSLLCWTLVHNRLVAVLTLQLITILGFLCWSHVALPHYVLDWAWIPTILMGLGVWSATRPGEPPTRWVRPLAVVVMIATLGSAIQTIIHVATMTRHGIQLVPALVSQGPLPEGKTLVMSVPDWQSAPASIPNIAVDDRVASITSIVVGHDLGHPPTPALSSFLTNLPADVRHITVDDVELYLLPAPLQQTNGVLSLRR